MSPALRDPALDSTLAVLTDGYDFIWKRCQRLQSDIFVTRLLGKRAVCVHGPEAAELFYDESRLQRHGALPRRVVTSLFGKRAIQTLDGMAHRRRKAAFLALMGPDGVDRFVDCTAARFREAVLRLERAGEVVLFDECLRVMTAAACDWAGIPLAPGEVEGRARDLARMVDAFGGVGPRLWKGKLARTRVQRWIAGCVRAARRGELQPPVGSALHVLSRHREGRGRPLDTKLAAIELLNVVRPTSAIAWYITFAVLALHEHPEARERLTREPELDGTRGYTDLFVQEVRRLYPFTPYLGAQVRRTFSWRGHRFRTGTLVLLDVYGTHRDPRWWEDPEAFRPERFADRHPGAFDFIPQGGGNHHTGHRCPGEWITIHGISLALHFLTRCMTYEVVPGQDLSFNPARMPTRPKSGFVIRNVRATAALGAPVFRPPSPAATAGWREAAQDALHASA